jgi:ABC superfamily ATP binding cassette transporter, membrane protein|nr:ABC transporter permease [uncultured Oribacterium sp.]
MNKSLNSFLKILFTFFLAILVGAIFILAIGENPIDAYLALLKGALGTKLGRGNVIAGFTPLLLTATAFAVAAKAGAFNVGVEGEVILGGITAAYIGINWGFLSVPLLYLACFTGAIVVAMLWGLIPAILKAYFNVSEVCVTILMNTVALYIGSYLVSGPMSAGVATPQSKPVLVTIPKIMKPSSANMGVFIAILVVLAVIWMTYKTKWGYKIRTVGTNPAHADYAGINSKKVFIGAMLLSAALGGVAGCIEVLGVHGYYLDGFARDLGTNGMLAALIVKSNMLFTPFVAFFLAVLKAGAMAMQQATSVPKSIVDTISAVFIIIATMDFVISLQRRRKLEKELKTEITSNQIEKGGDK